LSCHLINAVAHARGFGLFYWHNANFFNVYRRQEEVEELREEVNVYKQRRDSLTEELSRSGQVLCELERSVSSLYARLIPVRIYMYMTSFATVIVYGLFSLPPT